MPRHRRKLPVRSAAILASLLVVLTMGDVAAGAQKPAPHVPAVDPCNARLAIQVAADGTFNLGAFPDPADCSATPDSWALTFAWPGSPGTSFSTVRIDGQDAEYGTGTQVQAPTDVNATTNASAFQHGDVVVTQTLSIATNPQTGQADAARIAYTVRNDGSTSHDVGVRVMQDTDINYNDGAPFRIPGIGAVTTETDLSGASVPSSFAVFQDVTDPVHVASGTLTGSGAVTPDRFVIAAWPGIVNTLWDYTTDPQAAITGDSAYATYWDPQALAAGQERTYVTYFGLGDISTGGGGPLEAAVSGPAALGCAGGAYEPDPFDIVATIHTTDPVFGAVAQLTLPPELSLASGTALVQLGNLPADSEVQVTWSVTAAPQPATTVVDYTVTVSGGDQAPIQVTRSIELPACGTGGNSAPVAQDKDVSTPQDTPVDIDLVATDADLDPLTYAVVESPEHGALSGEAPSLAYTPEAGYVGPDAFTFRANDGTADSNIATVTIDVEEVQPGGTPGEPTDVTVVAGNGSAIVTWTPSADDGGSPVERYVVTCTATGDPDDVHQATVDGTATAAEVTGLTNDVAYACTVVAENANGAGDASPDSEPSTPSDSRAAELIDTSVGGEIPLEPGPDAYLGTNGHLSIPPQGGDPRTVIVTASLFGTPGETDETCGGNPCVGQGIEWAVSDPSAISVMRVAFFEHRSLVGHRRPKQADVYKDGVLLPDCGRHDTGCVLFRKRTPFGGWWVTIRVDGSDPKGRI